MTAQNKKMVLFLGFVVGVTVLRFSMIGELLTLENVRRSRDLLASTARDHPLVSALSFIASYVLVAGLSIPGAALLTMAGGVVFGTIVAAVYVNIGATLGATLAFLVARYLAGEWVQAKYGDKLEGFNRELDRNASSYLLGLRLAPVFPFFLINILSGLTRVHLGTFVWTTSLGIIPGSLLYSYAGRQLGSINSAQQVFSGPVIIAFSGLALFALLPALIDRIKRKQD